MKKNQGIILKDWKNLKPLDTLKDGDRRVYCDGEIGQEIHPSEIGFKVFECGYHGACRHKSKF